jgi:biopolymer transport protein ExbD
MKFERNIKGKASVPTASMGDIVFLLLIFFMVTTVFKSEDGLPVELPRAESGIEVKRENITRVYVDAAGRISVDDKIVTPQLAAQFMMQRSQENPMNIVGFEGDVDADYRFMDEIMEELKKVNAVRISFNNKVEGAQPKY